MLNRKSNNTKLIMETWRRFINESVSGIFGDDLMPDLASDPESFKCFKKPIPLEFRIAQETETIKTAEGIQTAKPGAYIMTGTEGENWPIPPEEFEYDILTQDGNKGTAAKQKKIVPAKEMNEPFVVKPTWSDSTLSGNPGDYLVQYSAGNYGVVGRTIFEKTYAMA